MDRRSFLTSSGLVAGSTLVGAGNSSTNTAPERTPRSKVGSLPNKPNIVLFITDQERATQHFPDGWEEENLPTLTRLKASGMSFERMYCSAAMCSPSRSSLFTGLYPAQHNVTQTLTEFSCDENAPDGTPCCELSDAEVTLSTSIPNLATVLKTAGYRCFFRGKWHMSKFEDGGDSESLQPWGFESWDPPDAGGDTNPLNAGKGPNENDARFTSDAINFIKNYDDDAPFFLVVSLVNPHDVLGYPGVEDQPFSDFDYSEAMLEGEISPPTNNNEALSDQGQIISQPTQIPHISFPYPIFPSYKPQTQLSYLQRLNGLGPLDTYEKRYQYVNFYGNLIRLADSQFGQIMAAMDERNFTDDTVIFRFSDHGEMATAHGGLRQKAFISYEEALRVPMVVSNPQLYQGGFQSEALMTLVDLVPTIASLVDVPNLDQYIFRGVDMSPLLLDPTSAPPQNEILFTFDDIRAGQCLVNAVPPPNRIRCLITNRYKYARIFDGDGVKPEVYEMYDLKSDPDEMDNVADPEHPKYDLYTTTRNQLAQQLADLENEKLAPLPTETPQVVMNLGAGSDLSISWQAEANVRYQVQYSEDLANWYDTGAVQVTTVAGELTMDVTQLFNAEGESLFLRVQMQ
ncbi:MAG: sulfatase-like hydrolase/transferase [Puniceicoccales bacterium]